MMSVNGRLGVRVVGDRGVLDHVHLTGARRALVRRDDGAEAPLLEVCMLTWSPAMNSPEMMVGDVLPPEKLDSVVRSASASMNRLGISGRGCRCGPSRSTRRTWRHVLLSVAIAMIVALLVAVLPAPVAGAMFEADREVDAVRDVLPRQPLRGCGGVARDVLEAAEGLAVLVSAEPEVGELVVGFVLAQGPAALGAFTLPSEHRSYQCRGRSVELEVGSLGGDHRDGLGG